MESWKWRRKQCKVEASNLQAERNSKKLSNNAQFKREASARAVSRLQARRVARNGKSRLSRKSHIAPVGVASAHARLARAKLYISPRTLSFDH